MLDRLAPHQRMLLLLRFQAELAYREIAALLDISEDAVRQRLSRARSAFSVALRGSAAGRRPRGPVIEPHIERDLQDPTAIQVAREQDIPLVGFCRGHQLLNILFGGALQQDRKADRVAADHRKRHPITAGSGSLARRAFGARDGASSSHHQAVSRIGRGLRAVAVSDDDVNEAVEVPRGRSALGVQFHPEERQNDGDRRLATALVDAAVARAA